MNPPPEAFAPHQIIPLCLLLGAGLFHAAMFLNAVSDTAAALTPDRPRRRRATPLLPTSRRVLPRAPWERPTYPPRRRFAARLARLRAYYPS